MGGDNDYESMFSLWKKNRFAGKDIKKYLDDNGIKQNYLSEKTGIPTCVLNMILNNKRKIEANEYMRICDALGLPLDYLRTRLPEKTDLQVGGK